MKRASIGATSFSGSTDGSPNPAAELSRFIEQAVRSYLFEQAVEQAKGAAAGMGDMELTELIDEAVNWARHN